MSDFRIKVSNVDPKTERKRVCCNCDRRILGEESDHCEIDGHRIGYAECFEGWCRRWKKLRELRGGIIDAKGTN